MEQALQNKRQEVNHVGLGCCSPCSGRNLATNCMARCRAASFSLGVGGGTGGAWTSGSSGRTCDRV